MTILFTTLGLATLFLVIGMRIAAARFPRISACPQCFLTTHPLRSRVPRPLRFVERRFCSRCGWEGWGRPLPRDHQVPPLPDVDFLLHNLSETDLPPAPEAFRWGRRTALWVPQFEWSEPARESGNGNGKRGQMPSGNGPPPPPTFAFRIPRDGDAPTGPAGMPAIFRFKVESPGGFQFAPRQPTDADARRAPSARSGRVFEFRPDSKPGFQWRGDD